jgi:hypothetical protein
MVSGEAVWCRADPDFDRRCRFLLQDGRVALFELVSEEIYRLMGQGGRLRNASAPATIDPAAVISATAFCAGPSGRE